MKTSRQLLAIILVLVVGVLVTGCGGSSENKELRVGNIGWDENVAVSNLTKVLLEDELGYDNVELKTLDVGDLFRGVGSGDLDAFQDVWLPNHKDYLGEVQDNVEQLDPWFQGTTRFGIAAPTYMDIASIDQLNSTDAQDILGIEPGAVIMEKIPDDVIPAYGLKQDLVESSTAGMLSEVKNRYDNKEDFAFVAWSPHWMNQRYEFSYLDDPKDGLGELKDPAQISTIVNKGLNDKDPVAYAFLKAMRLDEEQVNDLEGVINDAGDPLKGARQWTQDNRDVVEPWLEAARNAQQG